MWEHPRHVVPRRARPLEPGSAEAGAAPGSSRPGLPTPGQLFGALEPVAARSGGQALGGGTGPAGWGWRWPKRRALGPGAPLGSAGLSPRRPAAWPPAWTSARAALRSSWGWQPRAAARAVTRAWATAGLPLGVVPPRPGRAWA